MRVLAEEWADVLAAKWIPSLCESNASRSLNVGISAFGGVGAFGGAVIIDDGALANMTDKVVAAETASELEALVVAMDAGQMVPTAEMQAVHLDLLVQKRANAAGKSRTEGWRMPENVARNAETEADESSRMLRPVSWALRENDGGKMLRKLPLIRPAPLMKSLRDLHFP